MTSRERILAALAHEPVDRVPVDFGGTRQSGISIFAYARLRKLLDRIFHPPHQAPHTPRRCAPPLFIEGSQGIAVEDPLWRGVPEGRGVELTSVTSGIFGLDAPAACPRIFDLYQMLAEIEPAVAARFGSDCVLLNRRAVAFGIANGLETLAVARWHRGGSAGRLRAGDAARRRPYFAEG